MLPLSRSSLCLAACLLALFCLASPAQINKNWTTPLPPFHIAGNLYYVGSRDLAAYLVTTPAGNILINSNLESSPPQIRASVEKLGFKWGDTRILLNSQAHFDHAAGSAAILNETHAKFMVMAGDAEVAEKGGTNDFDHLTPFPLAHVDRVLHDGDTVQLGGATLVAHKTAGHTAGCTTWTMQVKEGSRLLNVVIVGGVSALDDYRLVATPGHPASYPGIAQDFTRTFAVLRSLPCDIFLGGHGLYFNMLAKLARITKEGDAVWIDPQGYQQFVAESRAKFEKRLMKEQKTAK